MNTTLILILIIIILLILLLLNLKSYNLVKFEQKFQNSAGGSGFGAGAAAGASAIPSIGVDPNNPTANSSNLLKSALATLVSGVVTVVATATMTGSIGLASLLGLGLGA